MIKVESPTQHSLLTVLGQAAETVSTAPHLTSPPDTSSLAFPFPLPLPYLCPTHKPQELPLHENTPSLTPYHGLMGIGPQGTERQTPSCISAPFAVTDFPGAQSLDHLISLCIIPAFSKKRPAILNTRVCRFIVQSPMELHEEASLRMRLKNTILTQ